MTRYKAALFDRIVTSEDIKHSKPAPDCYLKAAELRDLSHFQIPDFTDALDILKLG